jgi:hypothetical protein
MNQKALYYPYIHIQDLNWLKATLLLFSRLDACFRETSRRTTVTK